MKLKEAVELLCYGDWLNGVMDHMARGDVERLEAARVSVCAAFTPRTLEQMKQAWPKCPACKTGTPRLQIPAFRAMAVCNQHMDHGAFEIELNGRFCLNCGRPLTPAAWEELRKRLEALNDGKGD